MINHTPTNPIARINEHSTLPQILDDAARSLERARSSAEVLEVIDKSRLVYDAAKRIAKAKHAHDDVIAAALRLQADAAYMEARAKVRLADEYDAAQERGEVGRSGTRTDLVANGNEVTPTAADIGLTRNDIYEARKLRDAEAANPGIIRATVDQCLEQGKEPTKAEIKRAVAAQSDPTPEPRQPIQSRGIALRYSNEAIAALGKIPPNDPLRKEAMDDVARWIKHNR